MKGGPEWESHLKNKDKAFSVGSPYGAAHNLDLSESRVPDSIHCLIIILRLNGYKSLVHAPFSNTPMLKRYSWWYISQLSAYPINSPHS